jgi:hypothetical protein
MENAQEVAEAVQRTTALSNVSERLTDASTLQSVALMMSEGVTPSARTDLHPAIVGQDG